MVIAIVLVLVGAGSYAAFSLEKPGTQTSSSCGPSTSPVCKAQAGQVTLVCPFSAAQTGQNVPFQAVLPSGDTSNNYTFNFGDGSPTLTSTIPTVTHAYTYPGSYIVAVVVQVSGAAFTNYEHLTPITVAAAAASSGAGDSPSVSGQLAANTTVSTGSPSGVIATGGFVSVAGTYTSAPTNPLFVQSSPTISAPGGGVAVSKLVNTTTSASATVAFSNSGIYAVTFVGTATQTQGSTVTTVHQDYVWTVFVAASGQSAGTASASGKTSPHPGQLLVYESVPGGSRSEDPSIEYDSASGEVVENLFQTLIQYNGTAAGPDPTDFVPDAAVCVPGTAQCAQLFPSAPTAAGPELINESSRTYTFVLGSNSQFYDPATKASWGVYPTDVMFTILRTEAFSDLAFFGDHSGWIISQALLNQVPATWDSGIHAPFNNTPSNSFASILVNSSAYCPSTAMSNAAYHGCITLVADGSGQNWPFFLELVADATGMGIESCGWYSAPAQAAGIPGWTTSETGKGDHPCALPGGGTSTDASSYSSAVSAMAPTLWDSWQQAATNPPYVGNVQWNEIGSGPYYLQSLIVGQSYTLAANPAYAPAPTCSWTGCMPAAGSYVPKVTVIWEPTPSEGEQAYQAGTADAAAIPPTDTAILLQDLQEGKVQASASPTISTYFWPFNLNINLAATRGYTTNPVTVPADFFSYIGVREFFTHAYPYSTAQSTVNTVDGIVYDFQYGGAIPEFMGNYYPTNISWPTGDPSTSASTPGTAAWWWSQATTPSSAYYDPELTACTTSNPCQVPFFGQTGAPNIDQLSALLSTEVNALSGGRVKVIDLDVNFAVEIANIEVPGGQNAMPIFQLGWAPDYPDPTDYVPTLYGPGAYSAPDDIEAITAGVFNQSTYPGGSCPGFEDYMGYVKLAQAGGIPNACQGAALDALQYLDGIAGAMNANATRVLDYNYIEQIGNALALYVYWGQSNLVVTMAPWINPSTPNTSVMLGGGNEQTWWSWDGAGVV